MTDTVEATITDDETRGLKRELAGAKSDEHRDAVLAQLALRGVTGLPGAEKRGPGRPKKA